MSQHSQFPVANDLGARMFALEKAIAVNCIPGTANVQREKVVSDAQAFLDFIAPAKSPIVSVQSGSIRPVFGGKVSQ